MKSEFVLPRINVNDNDVEIVKWYVKDFDRVEKGSDLVEVSTSKASVVLEADASGFVKCLFQKGDVVSVGKVLACIYESLSDAQAHQASGATLAQSSPALTVVERNGTVSVPDSAKNFGFSRLSKKAQAYIAEHKIDPNKIAGMGLVSLRSLMGAQERRTEVAPIAAAPVPSRPHPPVSQDYIDIPPDPSLRSDKVDKIKKLEISALTAGQSGNINSSLTAQFDSHKVRATLRELKVLNGQMLPLMLYELAKMLEQNPLFTSFYYKDKIHFYDQVNIGVAIDLGEGLRVGVIKDANKLMPVDIFRTLTDYAMKYVKGKLAAEELTGGTVTVTDLSGDDILHFQPLVNQNQSIIFGFGGDSTQEGYPMTITGVFDHRVLTGRDVSAFLKEFKNRILSYESQNFSNLK